MNSWHVFTDVCITQDSFTYSMYLNDMNLFAICYMKCWLFTVYVLTNENAKTQNTRITVYVAKNDFIV